MRWVTVSLACRQSAVLVLILIAAPAWAEADALVPPDFHPPDVGDLCPAIEEDYEFCSVDIWSGNCPNFVTDARRLGGIYRSELREHPGWEAALRSTIWWGCGSAQLDDIRSALERLGTPQARAVLAEEPYRSLAQPAESAAAPPPHQERDCLGLSTQAERDACGARNLSEAKAEHARLYGACQQKVAPGLSGELIDAEASWEKLLPLECTGIGYSRDECLARAYEERAQSIASLHPECAESDPD